MDNPLTEALSKLAGLESYMVFLREAVDMQAIDNRRRGRGVAPSAHTPFEVLVRIGWPLDNPITPVPSQGVTGTDQGEDHS